MEPDLTSADAAGGEGPIVLFDGVCNLCNETVRWLIERDPDARLRFASLQSDAAREALARHGIEDPNSLPDSFVVIDRQGVHVRSTAALRMAGHLGLPYSLARGALIVPRPVRDGVYRVVARNRYRWFGRRDTCMRPTPELARRFLDAHEPVTTGHEHDPREADRPRETGIGAWARGWAVRFAIVYVVLYMLPFPLTLLGYVARLPFIGDIPGLGAAIGWVVGLYGQVMNPLVAWVGSTVFGVEATLQATGSGDRTFNYVAVFVAAVLSLVVATAWTARSRSKDLSPRVFDVSHVLARYYLATTMISYGWVKILPLQMPLPGPDRLMQPYGDSSPMGLVWTFIGASAAYQIFSGLCEALAGYLLFWRRTALLGALIAIAVMTNVMAINYFYDVPVKLFSTHLVLVAIFIAAPDLPRLAGFFGFSLPIVPRRATPFWTIAHRHRGWLAAAHLGLIGTITAFHVTDGLRQAREFGYLMERPATAGVWRVDSFERGGLADREVEDGDRWVRVGLNPPFAATIQRATGDAVRMRLDYADDARTLSFYDRGEQPPESPQFTYTMLDDGRLLLEGTFEGEPVRVILRRSEEGSLLLERGYHWINEYPFNR